MYLSMRHFFSSIAINKIGLKENSQYSSQRKKERYEREERKEEKRKESVEEKMSLEHI